MVEANPTETVQPEATTAAQDQAEQKVQPAPDQTGEEQPLSKNAQKRIRKQQEWERKKAEMKADGTFKRQKKKKSIESYSHLTRFNELSEVDQDGYSRKLSKKEKQKLYMDLCRKGPRVVIDCDFDSLMMEKEVKSLAQQLSYSVNINKQMEQPMNLLFTGIGDMLHTTLAKTHYENWGLQTYRKVGYIEADPVKSVYNEAEQSEKIDKSRLVYLTADSDNTLKELDPQDVYIIGGIVDRNRYVNLTLDRAKEQGIRHGRLPIGDYLSLTTSAVLTVNHVFQIIACQYNYKDWAKTLNEVIPSRKVKEVHGEASKVVVLGKRTNGEAAQESETAAQAQAVAEEEKQPE